MQIAGARAHIRTKLAVAQVKISQTVAPRDRLHERIVALCGLGRGFVALASLGRLFYVAVVLIWLCHIRGREIADSIPCQPQRGQGSVMSVMRQCYECYEAVL